MHRTLKLEATRPVGSNLLQQQEKLYKFQEEYNEERPHQALAMKCPVQVYQKSSRKYEGLPDLTYPGFDKTLMVTNCGRVCMSRAKVHLSRAFANQPIGLNEVDDHIWEVSFMDYDLGFFDEMNRIFSPKGDPFGIKLDKGL